MISAFLARHIGMLLSGAALIAAPPVVAQANHQKIDRKSGDILVNGQRMPAAEAPKSATCEAAAPDPITRRMLAAFPELILQPTRLPREPDYTKPPTVPPGSPLPKLGKGRFGTDKSYASESPVLDSSYGDPSGGELMPETVTNSYDEARIACQLRYTPGLSDPDTFGTSMSATGSAFTQAAPSAFAAADASAKHFALVRARIAARDTTLPMAFALFDQGRYAESLDWFKKAYRKLPDNDGGGEASLFIGKLYLQGLGEQSDTAEAIRYLKKAATAAFNPRFMTPVFDPKQPNRTTSIGEAALLLGNIYLLGFKDVAKDGEEAHRWYKRAYEVGHIPAAKMLGDMSRHGIGTPRDAAAALAWYKKAGKFGLASAQLAVANLLYLGAPGVKKDRHMALGWYKAAASSDQPDAIYALGHAFEFGIGVKADQAMALGFYKTAALKGSAEAATALGLYFHQGKIVPHDEAIARKWFAVAARENDPDGLFNLGAMLANGEGGERDLPGAWKLLKTASARGHGEAQMAMATVEGAMTATERQALGAAAKE